MFNKDLALKQAENYLKNNKIPAAIEEYKNIYQATKDLNTLNILGDLYIRIGDIPKAINSFLPIAEDYAKDGLSVRAIAMYKKLNKFAPTDTNILSQLAEMHAKKKLLGDARFYYNQLLEVYKRADKRLEVVKTLQALVEINPENLPTRMELAKICVAEGLLTEAHDCYLETGQMLLRLGIPNEAIELFEKALSIAHEPNLALKHLVETLSQNNQVERAAQVVRKVIEKYPDNIDPLILLGKTHLAAMQLDKAKKVFIEVVQKDPARYEYLLKIATMFLEEKAFDYAVESLDPITDIVLKTKQKRKLTNILKEILKQDPNHVITLNALVNIYEKLQENSNLISTLKLLVQACLNYGLLYEAMVAVKQLIKLEPTKSIHKEKLQDLEKASVTGKLNATASLAKVNLPKLGLGTNNSVPTKGDDPESTRNLMEGMLAKGGNYADAQLQLLEAMVSMDPDYWEVRDKLKNCYLQKGLIEEAAKECIEIAKIHKNEGNLEDVQKALAEAYSLSPSKKEELVKLGLKEEEKAPVAPPKTATSLTTTPLSKTTTTPLSNPNAGGLSSLGIPSFTPASEPSSSSRNKPTLEDNAFEIDLSSIFANADKPALVPPVPVFTPTPAPTPSFAPVFTPAPTNTDSAAFTPFIDVTEFCQANKILDKEWKRAIRNNQDISLIAIKIDNYQEKMKTFGDAFIQEATRNITNVIEENLNEGGEELLYCNAKGFLVLILPETTNIIAAAIAKTLDNLVSGLRISKQPFYVSISQAVVSIKPSTNNSPAALVEQLTSNVAKLISQNQIVAD